MGALMVRCPVGGKWSAATMMHIIAEAAIISPVWLYRLLDECRG